MRGQQHILTASCKHMVKQIHLKQVTVSLRAWAPRAGHAQGCVAPHQLPPQHDVQHRARLPNKVTSVLIYPLTFQWGKLPVKMR